MSIAFPTWPRREEYDLAMREWQQTLQDPELRSGELARDAFGIRRPGGAGLYVCSYRLDPWFVRCFCASPTQQPPPDILDRYQAIADFAQQNALRVPALVPVTLLLQGIRVGQRLLPVVKMPLIPQGVPLGRFIERYKSSPATLTRLAQAWMQTMAELEGAPLAHGDLDLTNVLIQAPSGPEGPLLLRLIDYDNMWVPALAGREQTEHGHEPFQHPAVLPPNTRPYTAEMDRFSALVLYLGMCALVQRPGLYEEWGADDTHQWLIGQADYRDPDRADGRLAQLAKMRGLDGYVDELRRALRERRMPEALPALVARLGSPVESEQAYPQAQPTVSTDASSSALALARGPAPASVPLDRARPPVASFGSVTRSASAQPYAPSGVALPRGGPANPVPPTVPLYLSVASAPARPAAQPSAPEQRSGSAGGVIAVVVLIVVLVVVTALLMAAAQAHAFGDIGPSLLMGSGSWAGVMGHSAIAHL